MTIKSKSSKPVFGWYALRVSSIKTTTVKRNILQIDSKCIKSVYDVNDFLKKHGIRKGIIFINMIMSAKLKYIINSIEGTYGFLPSNRSPFIISDFDGYISSLLDSAKFSSQSTVKKEEELEKSEESLFEDISDHSMGQKSSSADLSEFKPGKKVIITFGIFKDSIGYIQSVDHSNNSILVKITLEDSDLTMTTDISIFYAKII